MEVFRKCDDGEYRWVKKERPKPEAKVHFSTAYSKPLKSIALSVHPNQVEEFRKAAPPGVEYDEQGTCFLRGRSARNAELKRRECKDMDAGFGDYAGR